MTAANAQRRADKPEQKDVRMTRPTEAIERLEELAKAATPGPWEWFTSCSWKRLKHNSRGLTLNVAEPFVASDGHPDMTISRDDMAFIAAAREGVPMLLAHLHQLEEENAGLREVLEPFANEARNWAAEVPDDYRSLCTEPGSRMALEGSETAFTIGDLRNASALTRNRGGDHG